MNNLSHYTTLDTLSSIFNDFLSNRENNKENCERNYITMWASSVYTMNDTQEMQYGYEFLKQILPTLQNYIVKDNQWSLLDVFSDVEVERGTKEDVKRVLEKHFFNVQKAPFVLSFSTGEDSLPMWINYGDNGQGVKLLFKPELKKYVNDVMHGCDVCYGQKLDDEILCCLLEKEITDAYAREKSMTGQELLDDKIITLSTLFTIICPFVKNKYYSHENEYRISFLPSSDQCVRFRERNKELVPYLPVFIPVSMIAGLELGPRAQQSYKALEHLLYVTGLEEISISQSQIPYKG